MELEQRILQNLVDTRRGRTILATTHRLSIADRVAVMQNGRKRPTNPIWRAS
jgi:ABC-type multidrug transport system fused ATPase/permease subunit